jgi:enoyl-CoA hydratase
MNARGFDLDISDDIAHLSFNRGEALNTFTRPFWRAFEEAIQEIDDEAKARVIVISSTGKHFSAGIDLSVLADPATGFAGHGAGDAARHQEHLMQWVRLMQGVLTRLEATRMPVIAAIQGGCIGGALDLASACDLRYCTADAFFTIHEINLAIPADLGTFPRLCHLIPAGLVRELGYTGRRLSAEEAKAAGLVNAVYPTQDAMIEGVMGIAREIATKSPVALMASKQIMNYARDHSIADGLAQIALLQGALHHGGDMMKAIEAQKAKAKAAFEPLKPMPKLW